MFKRIIRSAGFLLFVGMIVIGAIYRTEARISLVSSPSNQNHSEEIDPVASTANATRSEEVDSVGSSIWQTVQGVVTQADSETLTVAVPNREPLIVEGQPLAFALGQGFTVSPGDTMSIEGYEENDEFKVAHMTNLTTGQAVQLRDADGRPGWSGRGQGK